MRCYTILFTLAISTCLLVGVQAQTIRIDIGEWAPFTSENDPKGKIAELIVIKALEAEGLKADFHYYPWKRSYENVKKGVSMGTFPWYLTEEREHNFIIHKIPIVVARTVFFHLKDTAFQWSTFEDLKNYKLGGTIGYVEESIYKKHGIKAEVIHDEESNFKKILWGRIDATPTDIFVGYNIIYRLFSPSIAGLFTVHPKPLVQGNMYMLISRGISGSQAFADQLDNGLRKIKDSGAYDEILDEYFVK